MDLSLGEIEERFANIIWDNEPIASGELARLAQAELGWKRTTTYTVLKRLAQRGLFQNEGGTVTSRVSRTEFAARRSRQFVAHHFGGSLPCFLAAFTDGKPLETSDVEALRLLIEKGEVRDDE